MLKMDELRGLAILVASRLFMIKARRGSLWAQIGHKIKKADIQNWKSAFLIAVLHLKSTA